MISVIKETGIQGKDFLTVEEAAYYCCVSKSQFRAKAKDLRVQPFEFLGRVVYSKQDLFNRMQEEQARCLAAQKQKNSKEKTVKAGTSVGGKRTRTGSVSDTRCRSEKLRKERQKLLASINR